MNGGFTPNGTDNSNINNKGDQTNKPNNNGNMNGNSNNGNINTNNTNEGAIFIGGDAEGVKPEDFVYASPAIRATPANEVDGVIPQPVYLQCVNISYSIEVHMSTSFVTLEASWKNHTNRVWAKIEN